MNKKYVLITGGSQGIGAGIVDRLITDGYEPVILDIIEPARKANTHFYKVDLINTEDTINVLNQVCEAYSIAHLVNNVGMVRPALLEDTKPNDFIDVMMLNASTAMLCVQAVLPTMKSLGYGRIVSITSRVVLGKELRTAYSASKGALGAMTRTWALELASKGITVNAVAPGPIETDAFNKNNPPGDPKTIAIKNKVPVNRLGTPEDVAQAVSFFMDENSGFITGQTLYVCGGLTIGLKTD